MEDYTDTVDELERRYEERRQYVADRKPYWLSLRHPRDGEMHYDLFNYFPDWHYRTALATLRDADRGRGDPSRSAPGIKHGYDMEPDGGVPELHKGTTRSTVYYWLDPDTGAALEHTGVNGEGTVPFFPDEASAEAYLERRAEANGDGTFDNLSLYKARTRKVGDAVDVLTDQSGIKDFVPDGSL